MSEQKMGIPYPPKHVFEHNEKPIDQVTAETQYVNVIERIDYDDPKGIQVYHRGSLFPAKGFPTPEAILAINLAKRFLITQFILLTKTSLKYFVWLVLFLPFRKKVDLFFRWAYEYDKLAEKVLRPYYLKVEKMTPLGQEIYRMCNKLFFELAGVNKRMAPSLSHTIATLIDYDTAYRYRILDLMSETKKEWVLDHPIFEIRRLMKLLKERDARPHLNEKFQAVANLLSAVLLVPRFRRIFKKLVRECDFAKLQLDEADRYQVLKLQGYNFMGRTIEDRWQEYLKMHGGKVPPMYVLQGGQLKEMLESQ